MQISANHPGFNFLSAFRNVVTDERPDVASSVQPSRDGAWENRADEHATQMQRETLLLQTAQRAAQRTTAEIDSLPEL